MMFKAKLIVRGDSKVLYTLHHLKWLIVHGDVAKGMGVQGLLLVSVWSSTDWHHPLVIKHLNLAPPGKVTMYVC